MRQRTGGGSVVVRLLATAMATVIATMLAVPAPAPAARADDDRDGASGHGSARDGEIAAGVQFGSPPASTSSGDDSGCTWGLPRPAGRTQEPPPRITRTSNGRVYRLWRQTCPGYTRLVWVPETPPRRTLASSARSRVTRTLPKPVLRSAPEAAAGVVNVGMWFWVDAQQWQPVSVTAWVPTPDGAIWSTTTATPTALIFDPGDGTLGTGPVRCTGPGDVWTPADGDATPSECMYTYRHASVMHSSGSFPARIGIEWSIAWQSNAGTGGTLPGQTTWSTNPIDVRDVQALVVS